MELVKSWIRMVIKDLIWAFAHFLVLVGLFLLAHQALVSRNLMSAVITDHALDSWGAYLGAISLFIVSISIYFEDAKRTIPTDVSRRFSAPFMIFLSILFFLITCFSGVPSSRYIDALGMIALGGAMMRLTGLPFKIEKAD